MSLTRIAGESEIIAFSYLFCFVLFISNYLLFFFRRFQYVLAAATSIATKINEETLTYLNQGQSYEIKLKKLGDLSAYRGKILKVIRCLLQSIITTYYTVMSKLTF